MGTASVLYRIVLLAHIASAIVGFGPMIANGILNATAFRSSGGAAAVILRAGRAVTRASDAAIYALLPLGIVLIALSDDAFGYGNVWVSASFVVWFLLVGAIHGAIRPAVRTLAARAEAIGDATLSDDPEAASASRRLMVGEAATQVLLAVALVLMLWKPGGS